MSIDRNPDIQEEIVKAFVQETETIERADARHSPMDRKLKFVNWIVDSEVGDSIVYWRGFLAAERYTSGAAKSRNVAGRLIGNVMWTACKTPRQPSSEAADWGTGLGLVELKQKKIGDFQYMYIAKKIKKIPDELKAMYRNTLSSV